jgi:hypothetical protein
VYKDASGNVGIGTGSPQARLHLESSVAESGRTLRVGFDNTFYFNIAQTGAQGVNYRTFGGVNHIWESDGIEKMRLTGVGNLEVLGSVSATNLLGVNQTLQNVTASRANNTTYTNTTARPIGVYVASNFAGNNDFLFVIDGQAVHRTGIVNNFSITTSYFGIVLPGQTYLAFAPGGLAWFYEIR